MQRSDVQRERTRGLRLAGLEDGGRRKPPARPPRPERDEAAQAVEQLEPHPESSLQAAAPEAPEPDEMPASVEAAEPVGPVEPVEHVERVEIVEVVASEPGLEPEPESGSEPEPQPQSEPAAASRAPKPPPRARSVPRSPFEVPRVARPRAASIAPALGFVTAVRSALARGLDLPAAVEAAASGLPGSARGAARRAAGRLRGDYAQDAWGYDEEFVEIVYPFFEFMYERWWRVQSTGVSNVPAHGAAMLVANHAGVLPWDATMMSVAIFREHPLPRQPRFMVLDWAFRLPWVSSFMRRVGGVVASPYNAGRLLDQGHLVMVFPEGSKGAGKPFSERYRLQRFGRGGFVEIALRTGAPIVPVAVVGSEEIYPKLGESRLAARLLGAPYFPITPTFPALGALGMVPLPSKWRIEFCEPIDLSGYGPEAAEDRTAVLELSEQVRGTIQARLLDNLVRRGSAFF